jgi:hypothetical protein
MKLGAKEPETPKEPKTGKEKYSAKRAKRMRPKRHPISLLKHPPKLIRIAGRPT